MKNIPLSICMLLIFHANSQNIEVTTLGSCSYLSEGAIHIEINSDFVSGYSLPYNVEWNNISNGNNGEIEVQSLIFDLDDLEPGDYEIIIDLGSGCEINLEAEVEEVPMIELHITKKIENPTCGYSNGNLILIPQNGTEPYNFIWENDAITFIHPTIPGAYMLANIPKGRYCVTVTDDACGFAEFCVNVEVLYPTVTIEHVQDIDGCQSSACNGEIEISVTGLLAPFTVEWEGPDEEIVGTGTTLQGLCEPGLYIARVYFSDHCQPWVYDVIITCCGGGSSMEVTLTPEPGCNGNNSIETTVTDGTPPYTYLWNNHNTSPNPENLPNGEYSVTVTDANGCTASESINFNPIEQLEVVQPCAGMFDGEATFQINNPDNCNVDVTYGFSLCYDCHSYPLIDNNTNSTITFTLDNLGGGIEYSFWVNSCGCDQEIKFTLEEKPFDKEFVGFDNPKEDVYVCIYDLDCKNTHIDEGEISLATVDLNHEECDPTQWPRPCGHIDYYCDPNEPPIATKEIRKKFMRRGEAILLAQDLGVYNNAEIEFQIGGNPCDRIWVCPNAPICAGLGLLGEFGGHWVGTTETDANGCYKVKCKFLGLLGLGFSYKICGKDYLPSYLAPYYDPTIPISIHINEEECIPVQKFAYEIAQFLIELEMNEPGFSGSQLDGFILNHLDDPALKCATVKYCVPDFRYLDSDIDYIICEEPISIPEPGECDEIDESCEPCTTTLSPDVTYVWCIKDCVERPGVPCAYPHEILTNYEDFNIFGFNGITPPQLICRTTSSTHFLTFSPSIQNDSFITVNAVYQGDGERLYHAFSYENFIPYKFDNLDYLFQHFDSSYVFAIVRDSSINTVNNIFYGDVGDLQEKKLNASENLTLNKTWSGNDFHYTTGIFKGNLEFDNNIIASSSLSDQYFILKMDRDANPLNVRKIKQSGWDIFIDEQSGDLGLWSPTNQSLYIDDQLQTGISSGEIVTLDGGSTGVLRDINLIISSNMKLIGYKRGPEFSGYVIIGSGSISLQGTQIYNNSTSEVLLVTIKNQGTGSLLKWIKNYTLTSIDTSTVAVEIVGLDSIYLALNTTNTITVEGNSITNSGGKDIVVVGYNTSGNLIFSDHYGSQSDEILKDLFYAHGVLFTGGELGGNTFKRTIGELEFVNFSPNLTHSFISYKILHDETGSEESIISEVHHPKWSAWQSNVEVFPNPADEEIHVRANQDCNLARIVVRDVNGKVISNEDISKDILSMGTSISVIDWPTGVYYLNILSDCSQLASKPFIIIH